MRVLVGTLYSGENEYEECIASIKRQKGVKYDHFVIKNLPNKKAHETLYNQFMERSNEFDIFIKVDADMVIEDENLFLKITQKFKELPSLKNLQIGVHDFFTDQLIGGMHAYHSSVKWEKNHEDLFVDIFQFKKNEQIWDDTELAPAAIHCKNPSPFQAFHYGVHKALKCVQPGRIKIIREWSVDHWNNIQRMRINFGKTRDKRVGFAILGAELTFRETVKTHHLDYTTPFLKKLFHKYQHMDSLQLSRNIKRISLLRFGFLSDQRRYRMLLGFFRIKAYLTNIS